MKKKDVIDFFKEHIDEFIKEASSAEILAERLFVLGSVTGAAIRFFEFFGLDASDISDEEFILMDRVLRQLWIDEYNPVYEYMFGRYGNWELGGDEV
ncbi:MAG: hypothetical protein IJ661_08215 [Lachnospiraceae bacterium]|nr:hypothetical protein [Lachnospiraceae bacterium]